MSSTRSGTARGSRRDTTALLAASVVVAVAGLVPFGAARAAGTTALTTFGDTRGDTYSNYPTRTNGGEPSIGYDTRANAAVYGAGTKNARLTWDDTKTPPAVTVADATVPNTPDTLDAITATDQATNRTFVTQLLTACSYGAYSDNAGVSYTNAVSCGVGTLLDHESIGGGKPFAGATLQPLAAVGYPDMVYYCAQTSYQGVCASSVDGGLTFNQGVTAYNGPNNDLGDSNATFLAEGGACSALHGHIRVGPDGTVYLPIKGCGGQPTVGNLTNTEFYGGNPSVSVSTDNGMTYAIHRTTGDNSDESDPSIGIGRGDKFPRGRAYLGWQDSKLASDTDYPTSSSARIAMSTDGGTTFSTPVDVSTPLGIHNVQFPEVIAGDDDRAAFAWLGTTAVGDDQHNGFVGSDGKPAVWDMYISRTYDGGLSWSTVDASVGDPIQRGCVDLQGTSNKTVQDNNICNDRNLLDFNDITLDGTGRVLVAYADGCTGTCVTTTGTPSTGTTGSVLRQSTGLPLYAAKDGALPAGTAVTPTLPESAHPTLVAIGALGILAIAVRMRRRRRLQA